MDAAQKKIEEIFDVALELPDAVERAAFLERECGEDSQLRAKIERLLGAHQRSESFFEACNPAVASQEANDAAGVRLHLEEELGKNIGAFKLLQKIGEGGWGVVYMAEQEKPIRRQVALKIIKLGMDTKSVIARFEAERQALAMMDHPNIARVLDAGATQTGRPYFVMELVRGIRITEYCDKGELDTRQRLDLFIQVCHAIQHAHQKGVIHRDIKPSNILVTMHDGVAVPKVIDFGIAKAIEEKLTDKTLFTAYGHFVGTPAYMSPEQAELSGLDVDTRSDIYSLGVLLYELLTGRPPFEQSELLSSGLDEMRRTLREREPHRPSTRLDTLSATELTITAQRRHADPPRLRLELQGDLDWIVMKALEKDRRRRYETANGLALDVRRYLENEPVMARPPSRWYRFGKLVRRNSVVFTAVAAVAIALVTGLGTATYLFFKEREMRQRAVAAELVAERARENEAELRRQAETREKVTQSAFLISQGKLDEADHVTAETVFRQPTLEGAAVLRTLGQWHALNGRWLEAGDRFLHVLQVDQLDNEQMISLDFLEAGVALASADETNRYKIFRRQLTAPLGSERGFSATELRLKASLLRPMEDTDITSLRWLARGFLPGGPVSIGNPYPSSPGAGDTAGILPQQLKLQNVGTEQPFSMLSDHDTITIVAGGANIWDNKDAFAYASAPVAGDFDFRMHVHSVFPRLDDYTRVGLMARESSDGTASRHVMVAVNENNTFQVVMRSEEGAVATSVPQNPLPEAYGSNSWVRLQRVGAIFHAYTSSNGVDWAQLYQTTGGDKPFCNPIYIGIAASAHETNSVATNVVSSFGETPTVSVDAGLTFALLEYRSGDFAKATDWCHRLLAYPECNMVQDSTSRIVLAMADKRLDQNEEARLQLAQASGVIDKNFSVKLNVGNSSDGFWYDWVFARVLQQEANDLIKY